MIAFDNYLKDTITIWQPNGTLDAYGRHTYVKTVTTGRYETSKSYKMDRQGVVSTDFYSLVLIEENIDIESLIEVGSSSDSVPGTDAKSVKRIQELKRLSGTVIGYEIWL